tara:strand:+ start:26412 stop:27155 length:744 start_codon:yes stop_codon:yes gene_type:complete
MLSGERKNISLKLPTLGNRNIPLRRSKKARRVILQVTEDDPGVELVVPYRTAVRDGLDFAAKKTSWIESQLKQRLPGVPLTCGTRIPYMGGFATLIDQFSEENKTNQTDTIIFVSDINYEFQDAALQALKNRAYNIIEPKAKELARTIEKEIFSLRINDPATAWGSCSVTGVLSFSWRLIMAPEKVLDYVIAHEVAHLVELNHSKQFWNTVEGLISHSEKSKAWLRRNGEKLKRYGRMPLNHQYQLL